MSKGNGESGGRAAVGGAAGRAAAIAATIIGSVVIAGVGYEVIRRTAKTPIRMWPQKITEAVAMSLAQKVYKNANVIRDNDVIVAKGAAKVGEAMRTEGGELVTPLATGKQIKRALKVVKPTYEELARRIDLKSIKGKATLDELARKQRYRRVRKKFRDVLVVDIEAARRRGKGA